MNSKQTWSLSDSYCQFEAKFRTLMIEETLSATNFRFVAKIHRKSVLCSDEMSLNRPWTFDRIFVRTFDERSLEQITKFAEFRLHYFCTILYIQITLSFVLWWILIFKLFSFTGFCCVSIPKSPLLTSTTKKHNSTVNHWKLPRIKCVMQNKIHNIKSNSLNKFVEGNVQNLAWRIILVFQKSTYILTGPKGWKLDNIIL